MCNNIWNAHIIGTVHIHCHRASGTRRRVIFHGVSLLAILLENPPLSYTLTEVGEISQCCQVAAGSHCGCRVAAGSRSSCQVAAGSHSSCQVAAGSHSSCQVAAGSRSILLPSCRRIAIFHYIPGYSMLFETTPPPGTPKKPRKPKEAVPELPLEAHMLPNRLPTWSKIGPHGPQRVPEQAKQATRSPPKAHTS